MEEATTNPVIFPFTYGVHTDGALIVFEGCSWCSPLNYDVSESFKGEQGECQNPDCRAFGNITQTVRCVLWDAEGITLLGCYFLADFSPDVIAEAVPDFRAVMRKKLGEHYESLGIPKWVIGRKDVQIDFHNREDDPFKVAIAVCKLCGLTKALCDKGGCSKSGGVEWHFLWRTECGLDNALVERLKARAKSAKEIAETAKENMQ